MRGADLLRQCDVVVYDRLIGRDLLDLARRSRGTDRRRQSQGSAPVSQDEINAILIDRGRAFAWRDSKVATRSRFARGGEEALSLMAAGVPFEYVWRLVCHRRAGRGRHSDDPAQRGAVVHGSHRPSVASTAESANWEAIAATGGTIVILMGSASIDEIVTQLQLGGLAADTPVAAIRWATTEREEVGGPPWPRLGRPVLRLPRRLSSAHWQLWTSATTGAAQRLLH